MTISTEQPPSVMDSVLSFVWLELTGKCQLECVHCYAESGPSGDHGSMATGDWIWVLDQAADLGASMVQFIGGEPTLHPALPDLVRHAVDQRLRVEVFSNLVHMPDRMWDVLALTGVGLATSYYSDSSAEHARITGRAASRDRTRANIAEAIRRSIPVRVGLIELDEQQGVDEAEAELHALGVTDIGRDRLRQVGRGVRDTSDGLSQLCGACGLGKIAVAPSGEVWPCVFSRWMPVGNVRERPLEDIIAGAAMVEAERRLAREFGPALPEMPCVPKMCDPQCGPNCGPACNPSCWPTRTGPCGPKGGCAPNYD